MRDFFRRIRTAWAVFRGDYKWLLNDHLNLLNVMEECAMFDRYDPFDARVRIDALDMVKDYPFILLYKETVSGNCYVDYCGTEDELEELKNQEIDID